MAIDEYLESEVAVAVVATAVALTPRARRVLRRGVVYGLAGALRAGDAVASFGQATARGAHEAAASAASPNQSTDTQGQGGET